MGLLRQFKKHRDLALSTSLLLNPQYHQETRSYETKDSSLNYKLTWILYPSNKAGGVEQTSQLQWCGAFIRGKPGVHLGI